ncbi:amidohydrolase [Congregibacter litoralis]|uniref:Amidohydrolase n=1 Tax=Congregibacter litoralis KT71 TaxID=314285 RepID=A4A3S6_9GAMM|nr:amidohydrolase [Congregibacter litoralis]EAQ99349.1 amidohydrolase [Congregibacter litoralis KT71]
MKQPFKRHLISMGLATGLVLSQLSHADTLSEAIAEDYESHLEELFVYFHQNPELSFQETKTAARLAAELRETGFEVTEGVGGTGLVAILENGPGPLVMMRADMDGLPVEEKSGLEYASRAKQTDPDGNEVFVMHACGHDVHITSLVGTARQMMARRDDWSGTLMLIGQPAEERISGAEAMMEDNLWERFGQPDMAMAFHVTSSIPTGKLSAAMGAAYSGGDTVEIVVHGVGAHGASPHTGVDPVVLGSQIVLALQTVVSRTLPPRDAGVITVGAFHAGTKNNIISDRAVLKLTVRNDDPETRELLLDGIRRVAVNMGRVAGLPDDKLPEVIVSDESVPVTANDLAMTERLRGVWQSRFGSDVLWDEKRKGMGSEDFPFFTTDPYIPSTYFAVGGTPPEAFSAAAAGGEPVPSHHSPLFKIAPEPAVTLGVEATVVGLMELMGK